MISVGEATLKLVWQATRKLK